MNHTELFIQCMWMSRIAYDLARTMHNAENYRVLMADARWWYERACTMRECHD
jgi:hypothetical protein